MEKFLFFNSIATDRRLHEASDMADYWSSFLSNGVIGIDALYTLNVEASGTDMNIKLTPGRALIRGHLYINTEDLIKPVAQAPISNDRIDRLVLRFDNTLQNRYIKAFVKEGNSTTPPALTRNDDIFEISLAQIKVTAGQSYLSPSDIIDERDDKAVCGFSTILASKASADDISLPDPLEVLRTIEVESAVYELLLMPPKLNVYRSQLDSKGVWKVVEDKREDNTLARKTELSNADINGNYQTQVITIYMPNGVTPYHEETWNITYDENGNVVSEVLV